MRALYAISLIAMLVVAMASPAVAFSKSAPAPGGNALNRTISYMMKGVEVALKHVKKGTQAYAQLNESLAYLKMARDLLEEGNETGAFYYFDLATNSTYRALTASKPFSIPPGLNVSRLMALDYSRRLMAMASSISNSTLRSEIMTQIQEAVSLLQSSGNATQIAHNLAAARKILGNVNAEIHRYAKEKFLEHFRKFELPRVKGLEKKMGASEASALNKTISGILSSYQQVNSGELIALDRSIYATMLNTTELLLGTIGTYNGSVYVVLYYPIRVISLNGSIYVAGSAPIIYSSTGMTHGRRHGMAKAMMSGNLTFVGVISSQQAYDYVLAESGELVTVFPPAPSSMSQLRIVLYDVGSYASQPAGNYTFSYRAAAPAYYMSFNVEQELNASFFNYTDYSDLYLTL
ncbi:MAG: hypothetical protein ACP5GH_03725 [Nitrososphaeria archaeon]